MSHFSIRHIWASVLDLVYPPHCVGCQAMGAWFCDACLSEAPRLTPPFCLHCGNPVERSTSRPCTRCRSTSSQIERIRSVVYSEGAVRAAIHAFKYDSVTALVVPLANLMVAHWSSHPMAVDIVVPVPLHKDRLRKRGFNQAAYLACELARHVGLAVEESVLVRHRATAAQVDLDPKQRKENVRGAFRCIGSAAVDKRVLLIDDVYTTGSTLEACAEALRQGGAKGVQALTLARAR